MTFARTALLLLVLTTPLQASPRYALEALPAPPDPVYSVLDINNAGQIAGSFQPTEFQWRGFLYTPGKGYAKLEPYVSEQDVFGMSPRGLNERGEVAGTYRSRAFVYRADGSGGFLPQVPPWVETWAMAIADNGQVLAHSMTQSPLLYTPFQGVKPLSPRFPNTLGTALDLNNAGQALVGTTDLSGGATLSLLDIESGALNAVAAVAPTFSVYEARVNDSGLIAATVGPAQGDPKAVLYRSGQTYELWRLTGQPSSYVRDLDGGGRVLGEAYTAGPQGVTARADFLFIPGVGITWPRAHVDPATLAGWSDVVLAAINDRGQIAGIGTFEGQRRAFVLNEVP